MVATNKRRDHLNAVQSTLEQLEQHLASENERFFGGLQRSMECTNVAVN